MDANTATATTKPTIWRMATCVHIHSNATPTIYSTCVPHNIWRGGNNNMVMEEEEVGDDVDKAEGMAKMDVAAEVAKFLDQEVTNNNPQVSNGSNMDGNQHTSHTQQSRWWT